jgi:hypothetical protein
MHSFMNSLLFQLWIREVDGFRIGSYNFGAMLAAKKEGCLQLNVLAEELEGMGVRLCGLQELHWPYARECGTRGRGRWAFMGYKSSIAHLLGSVTSSYHLTCRGIEGKGIRSLCGLGLTNDENKVWAC